MGFIKNNLAAISGLLICSFLAYLDLRKSSPEKDNTAPIFIGIAVLIFILLVLIYFKHYRNT